MSRKILFFDIDGTLITTDKSRTFPESAKRAIREAREKGHLAFINTGRVFVNVDEFIKEAGFDGYVCGCGTQIIVNDKELFHHKLTKERCMEVALKARECYISAIYEHADLTSLDLEIENESNKELIEYFRKNNRPMLEDIFDPRFIYDKFTAWYDVERSNLQEFRDFLTEDFYVIEREGDFLEVVPKGFSKATGIEYLLKYYDIPLSDAYVFGDSNNDLEMLQYVPNSVGMGVCTKEVEEAVSYKTTEVLQDGIYLALKHFGVI